MKATQEQREVIGRLQYSREGKILLECLQATITEFQEKLIRDDDMHRARLHQGCIRVLHELISLLTPVS